MASSTDYPKTAVPDSTLSLLREGYEFIGNRCRRYRTDTFRTRLMLSDVVCMSGAQAAEFFYDGRRFSRERAMPVTVLKLLQDRGSVQQMEDESHHARKQLFMSMMEQDSLAGLVRHFSADWRNCIPTWRGRERIVLFDEVCRILTRAVCAWAGVPLADAEADRRARELAATIENAGRFGPRNWHALLVRRRLERWAGGLVAGVRRNEFAVPEDAPLQRIARHRDSDGFQLGPEVAAVELLNVLRPTVAVAHFILFAAMRLHEYPEWYETFAAGHGNDLEGFVQEVRRLSPFFPFVGGRTRSAMDWRGGRLAQGQWVILDLYGTCRDGRVWTEPEIFRPERFDSGNSVPPGLVPQGTGDYLAGHRCPGEWIAIELTKQAVRLLTQDMRYDVPAQDLSVDLSRIPALPPSGFVMENVRPGT